jgi:hypothetical protein
MHGLLSRDLRAICLKVFTLGLASLLLNFAMSLSQKIKIAAMKSTVCMFAIDMLIIDGWKIEIRYHGLLNKNRRNANPTIDFYSRLS